MAIDSIRSVKIFYCYAHEDKPLRDELDRHLGALKRSGQITTWHDREIHPGMEWAYEIDMRLNSADIVLLLVSPDFIDSDYCYGREMNQALERHEAKEACVIPIILRPVDCEGTPIDKLQMLPSGRRPITRWHDRDEAFINVARGIREVVRTLLALPKGADQESKEPLQESSDKMLPIQSQRLTINTHEAIKLFHQLLQPKSQMRILRLVGEGKMGKSHLLTQVFPSLVQQEYQARWALLDLSYQFHTVPDLLSQTCAQFGNQGCDGYYAADLVWVNRPKVEAKNPAGTFSYVHIPTRDDIDVAHRRDRILTKQFVRDVGQLDDKPLLLLFDSVDRASEEIRTWLMEVLLVSLSRVDHVRAVIAGRSLPKAHGSYQALCQTYHLLPIKEVEAFVTYCQHLDPSFSEQYILVLAHAFDYIPGLFVELLPKFLSP